MQLWTRQLVKGCCDVLQTLCIQNNVKLCLVSAHCGIEGKKLADVLAKEEARSLNNDIVDIKLPLSVYKIRIRDRILKETSTSWMNLKKHKVSRNLWLQLAQRKSNLIVGWNRNKLRTVIGNVQRDWTLHKTIFAGTVKIQKWVRTYHILFVNFQSLHLNDWEF